MCNAAEQPAGVTEQQISALLAWGRARGVFVHPSISVAHGAARGRGYFATAKIRRNESLIRLSRAQIGIQPTPALQALVKERVCSRIVALTLTLMDELHHAASASASDTASCAGGMCEDSGPVAHPYFGLLAASAPPDCPLLWKASQLAHLEGTSLMPCGAKAAAAAAAARASYEADVLPIIARVTTDARAAKEGGGGSFLPPEACSFEKFASALAWVMSRAALGRVSYEHGKAALLPYLRPDGPPTADHIMMLPVFDFLNTSSEPAAVCAALVQGDDALEVKATRDIPAGAEVLISYGSHGAAELLRTYGIVEERPSPHTSLDFLREEVIAATRASLASASRELAADDAAARFDALESAGRLPLCFTVCLPSTPEAARVPPLLLTAVQVLLMDGEELAEWRAAGCIALGEDFLDDDHLPHVVGALLELAETRLRRYPTAADGADDADPDAAGREARMAQALREAERQLLLGGFKRAVLALECAADDDEDDEDDDEEGESDGEEGDEEDEEEEDEEEEDEEGDGVPSKPADGEGTEAAAAPAGERPMKRPRASSSD